MLRGMTRYADLIADAQTRVREIMPWELAERLERAPAPLLLDVREANEFAQARIAGSINVPRGVLEAACEWDYGDTVPELAAGRARAIVVVCRSGQRSLLAADTLLRLGFVDVASLKSGVRGWNDFERELVDGMQVRVDGDAADTLLASRPRPDQMRPR